MAGRTPKPATPGQKASQAGRMLTGQAGKAAKQIEDYKARQQSRLDDIMGQIARQRKNQTTDSQN